MGNLFDLTGKVAIITGSSSGIGAGIAEVFAEQGAQVIICGRATKRAQGVIDGIIANGGKASFHALETKDEASIKALIDDTAREFGKIDILVNNAANTTGHGLTDVKVADVDTEIWDDVIMSDLRSVFLACKYVIPYMQKQGGGAIVNTGSTGAAAGNRSQSAYSVAKGGIEMLTRNVAYQYGKDNIRCNCIRPGLVIHARNDRLAPQFMRDIFLKEIEVNRYGTPRDIGYMALFLASDEAGFVTSQIIDVDGGMFSHAPQNTPMNEAEAKLMKQS